MVGFKRRSVIAGATAALLATPAWASPVGKPAAKYSIFTLDRLKVSSDDLKGKVVVLNYWAWWCGPCKLELVVLENYLRSHPGTDLKIFAIETDSVPAAKLKPLANLLSFPLATSLSSWGYGMIKDSIPTSYVIDRGGIVRHADAGAFTDESFDALVTPLLAEAPPAAGPAKT